MPVMEFVVALAASAPRPGWLDLVSGLGVVGATSAVIVGAATLRQKGHVDRREAWWKRAQWAMERALSDDPRSQALGTQVLLYLSETKMARKDERLFLGHIGWLVLAQVQAELGEDPDDLDVVLD